MWAALLAIPFGETRSYAEIARQVGNPVRCVRWARPMAATHLDHRALPPVIGSSGNLTGFAGGLAAKRYLLALEGRQSLALDL